ncbi:ribonuclease PH [Synergistes jonesii]|uniref:ribonuclease PH n=1 Tax=Synergistes jonesii TaxID=2754 RepID=UPI00248DF896|nr:ribonuclease PH [Synergistes jonesii]
MEEIRRAGGRGLRELREISFERGVNRYAEGSALVRWGDTHVLCTASVEEKVPPFMRGDGAGWITAEYAMLPRATAQRSPRDAAKGRVNGRASEIQRLIGRSLRAAVELSRLGERTVTIDCDVLQADGGTRTASISAGFIALFDALRFMRETEKITEIPLKKQIAAVSVGKVGGRIMLDLCYEEDAAAEVDANLVMTGAGDFIELQGTGEGGSFSRAELAEMIAAGWKGIAEIQRMQRDVLELSEGERELFDRCV